MRTPIIQALCALFLFCAALPVLAASNSAQADAAADAMPPLIWAVNQGEIEKVQALLAAGTPLHLEDSKGLSALDHALAYSPSWAAPDLVHLLLQHGAPAGSGADGQELALARLIATRALPAEVQSLLAKGFKAEGSLANGFTPFLWAAASGVSPEYINLLIEYGVPLDQSLPPDELSGGQAGNNALLLAAQYNPQVSVVRALLRHGLDVNARANALGDSALMLALCLCSNPSLEVAQALLDARADVQVSNGISYTAFLCAARREGTSALLRLLVQRGADAADVADGGTTAMHEAAMHNPDTAVIQTLLDLGTPISGMSAENEAFLGTDSVLKLALEHNPNPAVIRLLLEKGVDSSRRDENGKLAWEALSQKRKAWLNKNGLDALLAKTATDAPKTKEAAQQSATHSTIAAFDDARLALADVSRKTDLTRFPGVQGKLVKALRYQDQSGDNLILLTRTEEMFRRAGEERYLAVSREIFAYRFLMQGSAAKQQWRVRDYVLDCQYEVDIDFIMEGLELSDLDKNGLAEVWLPYRLGCRAEQAPAAMKIIMYEDGQKYAMRGQSRIQYANSAYAGGDYVMDKALREAPQRFRDFAATLWLAHMNE